MKNQDFLLATVLSAVSGAVIGLLLTGEKKSTQRKIHDKGDKYLERIKREIISIRNEIDHYKKIAKKEADNVRDQAYTKGEEVLDRAKQVSSDYEEWTKEKLSDRAKALNIEGCLSMTKNELIEALKKIK